MEFQSTRSVEPLAVTAACSFDQADLEAAFATEPADEDLFYDLFGPLWSEKPVSEQLSILSKVAVLAEQAAHLNPQAKEPVLKES